MKNNRGITMMVLVVTVVILIILAATTIGIMDKEDRIINKTKFSKIEVRADAVERRKNEWILEKEAGYTQKNLYDLIAELRKNNLLTEEEAGKAKNEKKVDIGSRTIKFDE